MNDQSSMLPALSPPAHYRMMYNVVLGRQSTRWLEHEIAGLLWPYVVEKLMAANSPLPFYTTGTKLPMKLLPIVVCFITKSFLTYSFVLPTPTLSTICRPLSSYTCSITPETVNVGSSYSHMRGPGVGCWLSDRSSCSHWSFEDAVLPINPNIYTD